MKIRVKKLKQDAEIPRYGRPGDAGMDLYSYESVILQPGERRIISTAVAIAIPAGTVGLVWDRSGMAANHGIKTMAGVLDHTYRGEIRLVLLNTYNEPYEIRKGDRVAQLLVQPIHNFPVEEVNHLEETARGEGRFGSSGR